MEKMQDVDNNPFSKTKLSINQCSQELISLVIMLGPRLP